MAKRSSKKPDPIALGLEQLAIADKKSARALRRLFEALLEPSPTPVYKTCRFEIGDTPYKARLTSYQCQLILKVVSENGNVKAAVDGLVGGLDCTVRDAANALAAQLDIASDSAMSDAISTRIELGCCVYNGGQTPNLSQAQCNQYNGEWDPKHPDCTHVPPRR